MCWVARASKPVSSVSALMLAHSPTQGVVVGDTLPRSARLRLNKANCGTRKTKVSKEKVRLDATGSRS